MQMIYAIILVFKNQARVTPSETHAAFLSQQFGGARPPRGISIYRKTDNTQDCVVRLET